MGSLIGNYKEFAKLTKGEQDLIKWQYPRHLEPSGFVVALFGVIAKSDESNLGLLELGFPTQVQAYRNFTRTKGWWQDLVKRMEIEVI